MYEEKNNANTETKVYEDEDELPPAVEEPIDEEPIVEHVPEVNEKKKGGRKPKNQMIN